VNGFSERHARQQRHQPRDVHLVRDVPTVHQVVDAGGLRSAGFHQLKEGRRLQAITVQVEEEVTEERAEALARDHPEVVAVVDHFATALVVPGRPPYPVFRRVRPRDDRGCCGGRNRRENRDRPGVHRARFGHSLQVGQTAGLNRGADNARCSTIDDDQ
jgi:hypothetical protein